MLNKMDLNSAERQINLPMGNVNNEQNGANGHTNMSRNLAFAKGLAMTNRDPVDLQFKDITYTVKLGFNKGMYIHFAFDFSLFCNLVLALFFVIWSLCNFFFSLISVF